MQPSKTQIAAAYQAGFQSGMSDNPRMEGNFTSPMMNEAWERGIEQARKLRIAKFWETCNDTKVSS